MSAATWSVWQGRINPPHKQVVAILPGRGAVPGKLVVSSDDADSSEIDSRARLIAAAPALKDGCNALLGLIQLVCARDDMPPAIRDALTTSHRVEETRAAIAAAESQP